MTTPDISLFADEPAPLSPELQAVVTQVQKKLHWHDLFPRSLPLTFCVIVVAITVSFVFGRLGWHDFTWRGSLSTATFYLAINLTAEFVGKLRLRQKSVNQLCGSDSIRVLPAILAIQETAKNRQRGQSEKWLVERLPTFSESELRTIGGRARRQLIKLLVSENVSLAEATLDALEKIPASDCLYALGMLVRKYEKTLSAPNLRKRAWLLECEIEQRRAAGAETLGRASSLDQKGEALLRPSITTPANLEETQQLLRTTQGDSPGDE